MDYPFEPKSIRLLLPGQYWAVPLSDGRYACGRVLAVRQDPDPLLAVTSRVFLAGLLDWVGAAPPSGDKIKGARLLRQGFAHVRTNRETGGTILGLRALELDDIEPYSWRTSTGGPNAWVYRGAERERPATTADSDLAVMSTWGFRVVQVLAEAFFVQGRAPQG